MIIAFIGVAYIIISAIMFAYEIKHAPLVDEKEPFLRGDYDPKKDPTMHTVEYDHAEKFCKFCKYYDGVAMCLHEDNLGQITHDLVMCCKNNSYFNTK